MSSSETVKDYSDVLIHIPDYKFYMLITDGAEEDMCEADFDEGYKGCIIYNLYDEDGFDINEFYGEDIDGGLVLLDKPSTEMFSTLKEAIPYAFGLAQIDENAEYEVIDLKAIEKTYIETYMYEDDEDLEFAPGL